MNLFTKEEWMSCVSKENNPSRRCDFLDPKSDKFFWKNHRLTHSEGNKVDGFRPEGGWLAVENGEGEELKKLPKIFVEGGLDNIVGGLRIKFPKQREGDRKERQFDIKKGKPFYFWTSYCYNERSKGVEKLKSRWKCVDLYLDSVQMDFNYYPFLLFCHRQLPNSIQELQIDPFTQSIVHISEKKRVVKN